MMVMERYLCKNRQIHIANKRRRRRNAAGANDTLVTAVAGVSGFTDAATRDRITAGATSTVAHVTTEHAVQSSRTFCPHTHIRYVTYESQHGPKSSSLSAAKHSMMQKLNNRKNRYATYKTC